MQRGTFAAAVSLGVAVPLVAIAAWTAQPAARAWLGDFFAPMPSPAPRAARNVEALPQQIAITGAESAELQLLGAVDGAAPTTRGPRTSLFPRDLPATHDAYQRPRGLKRTELATHEDASVDGAIQYLATDARGHGALLAAVQRSGRYRDEVSRILQAWKIPSELAAVAFVESGFVPTASSLDGGAGLWSLVPEVAHAYGVAVLPTYDERRGFALSTEAAAHHLADLHERLGSWELALYAFGRGYARSLDDLRGQSSLEYWDIAPGLPAEGASYVAEVLAVATVLANPDRFGLDVVHPDEPLATSDLEVPADATFAILARAAGTPVDRLHELNPEYLGEAIPNTGFAMTVHLPGAALARAKELLMPLMYSPGASLGGDTPHRPRRDAGDVGAAAVPGEGSAASPSAVVVGRGASRKVYYRVQEGDTLDSLARRFALSRETIASDNSLDPAAGLKPDQLLLLRPGAGAAPAPSSTP